MKKSVTFLLLCLFSTSQIEMDAAVKSASPVVKELLEVSKKSSKKLPMPSWSYIFKNESLYHSIDDKDIIDKEFKKDAQKRFDRMVHTLYLNPINKKEMFERAHSISAYIAQIESYMKNKMNIAGKVQHISVYGSYLYNMNDADDIDMLIVVDSPIKTIFEHADVDSKIITGNANLPKFSFQVIDYNTYIASLAHANSPYLTRNEKLALQHIAVGSGWYFTIYGYDFRFDDPHNLKDNTKVNYLNKSIVSLNAAGARLYKSGYSYLPYESEKIRLRKVVSRILISDFLIPVMDNSIKATPTIYAELYADIRLIKDHETVKWKSIEKRINKLYFKKLEQLLSIAEKQGKLDEIIFKDQ
ncbi:MAG: hypothetical protein H0W50_01345 [Parachlamydiaceae bacterium]|nr:hypothetical protein [Parachlamydiaceae bacterium]